MSQTGDRRPIASRSLPVVIAFANWLVRRRVSPNGISVAGMVAGILAGVAFALTPSLPGAASALWLAGAVLVPLRLLANMMDGMVAVARNIASPVGELFNEVPDRISDVAVLLGLGIAAGDPALGLAAGLAAVVTAYVRALGKSAGAPSEFCGPMAKQQRMVVAMLQAVVTALLPGLWHPDYGRVVLAIVLVLSLATAARRLARTAAALQRQRP